MCEQQVSIRLNYGTIEHLEILVGIATIVVVLNHH